MHVQIFTFTRPNTDVPFFQRSSDISVYFTTMHVEGKILLEKCTFSEDMLVYTRATHWKSKEIYEAVSADDTMVKFFETRDAYLRENNVVMTEAV